MPRGAPHKVPHVRACATLCGLGASSWAHSRRTIAVFAVRKSVRVGAAPKGPQKAQNLQFERPARRCRKPTTPLGADLRRAMRPRAPKRVVCRVVCRVGTSHMRCCSLHVACPPLVQACGPPRTDGSEAPCTRKCHLVWPRRELMGPYAPHRRVVAVWMLPVRVGAAPKAPKQPKICNLGGPCGVARSQKNRYALMHDALSGTHRDGTAPCHPLVRVCVGKRRKNAKNRSNGIRIPCPPLPAVLLHDMHAHASACAHAHEHGPVAPILSQL